MSRRRTLKIKNLKGEVILEISGDTLVKANLKGKHLTEADFRNLDLTGIDLERSFCMNADFSGAILKDAYMPYSRCTGAIFRGTDFENANLERAVFRKADLLGAKNWNKLKRDLYAEFDGATMPDGQKVEDE